ncbi:hypothetical protein J6590_018754 [Homalodisca vitripennis]|nr:hypothetical protein J6590_018754 [Homalodisca vitripennis]
MFVICRGGRLADCKAYKCERPTKDEVIASVQSMAEIPADDYRETNKRERMMRMAETDTRRSNCLRSKYGGNTSG